MSLLERVFGCSHKHCSFPITLRGKKSAGSASATGTYVVCLDCGQEFAYDWNQMKMVDGQRATSAKAAYSGSKAA